MAALPHNNAQSPSPSTAPPTLSAAINAATRSVHSRLNKLIVSRIPLALPPHTDTPAYYAHGLDAFAEIYYTFERTWHELNAHTAPSSPEASPHELELKEWLGALVPAGLWRTDAIKRDMQHLSRILHCDLEGAQTVRGTSGEFLEHIVREVRDKPHVLVAYAWIMYMAIFSGGRWIRQQFIEPGPAFWRVDAESDEKTPFGDAQAPVPGFSLFFFEGTNDGEDIKADFKARLERAEQVLTEEERGDVLAEAQYIFDMCVRLVETLDTELDTASRLPSLDTASRANKGHNAATATLSQPADSKVVSQRMSKRIAVILTAALLWCIWLWLNSR